MLPTSVPVTIKERLPVGSILNLTLTQPLDIPINRSFIYIANGKVALLKNFNTVDVYEPYCMFRLHKEVTQAHLVLPDQFEVTKIIEWEGYYSINDYRKFAHKIIRSGGLIKAGFVNDNESGSNIIRYATILSLYSNKQPDVKELVCGHWDEQSLVEPLTLEEMKTALGSLITIGSKII